MKQLLVLFSGFFLIIAGGTYYITSAFGAIKVKFRNASKPKKGPQAESATQKRKSKKPFWIRKSVIFLF